MACFAGVDLEVVYVPAKDVPVMRIAELISLAHA